MRILVLFLLLLITSLAPLYALNYGTTLDVIINYGKQNNQTFSVLNLDRKDGMQCHEMIDTSGEVTRVVCKIGQTPIASFAPTNTVFFRFWNRVIDGKFYLYIEPNYKMKLYNTYPSLTKGGVITKERPSSSPSWQIIGYKDKIPFISQQSLHQELNAQKYQVQGAGLNFPIEIANNEIFIDELNIERGPLVFETGPDFDRYIKARDLINSGEWLNAIKSIDDSLQTYPNSIFVKDLVAFRIKALHELGAMDNADSIVELGVKWIKRFPTEMQVPEVMYYVAEAYNNISFGGEAKYYFERLIADYPKSYFAPLAKIQLARKFYGLGSQREANLLFTQAYTEAQDLDSASLIAITWAEFYFEGGHAKEGRKLIDTLMQAHPVYLIQHPQRTLELIEILKETKNWEIAGMIAQYLYEHLDDETDLPSHEILDRAAIYYKNAADAYIAQSSNAKDEAKELLSKASELDSEDEQEAAEIQNLKDKATKFENLAVQLAKNAEPMYDKSHELNQLFLKDFPNKIPLTDEVRARDDELLFDVGANDTNEQKIARYDYLMSKYPDSEVYDKAMRLKAQILFDAGKFNEVVQLGDDELNAKSYRAMIQNAIKTRNCGEIAKLFDKFKKDEFSADENFEVFKCLYDVALNAQAQSVISGLAKSSKETDKKLKFAYYEALNLDKLGRNKEAMLASRAAFELARTMRESKYYDVGFVVLKNLDINSYGVSNGYGGTAGAKDADVARSAAAEMAEIYNFMKAFFGDDLRLVDSQLALLKFAENQGDDSGIELYASEIFKLQKLHNVENGSPYADFALTQSRMKAGKYDEALQALDELLSKDVEAGKKAQAYYLKGSILKTLGRESKASFEACKALNAPSFSGVCAQMLELQ